MFGTTQLVYAAYWNETRHRIDVWQSSASPGWTKLPDPFPGISIGSHPLFVSGVIAAVASNGSIWVNTLSGTTWARPMLAASDFNNPVAVVNGESIRSLGFTLDVGPQASPFSTVANIWYQSGAGLKGVRCTITPSINASCFAPSGWHTPTGWTAFSPALAAAHVNDGTMFGHNDWFLTTWKADTSFVVSMVGARIDLSDSSLIWGAFTGEQVPCASTTNQYWGDYDVMRVEGNGLAAPKFHRGLTVSDSATCSRAQSWNALPQHVSELIVTGG
jgi:hypothetical protein